MEKLYWDNFTSALGEITVCCSDRGVREISLGAGNHTRWDRKDRRAEFGDCVKANGQQARGARWVRQAVRELEEYLAGRRRKFTVPLDLRGTDFQKKVWKALRAIPFGATRSYGEIARQAGNARAARAVGMANHDNPIAIVVPCHRVIASDGSLGGYAGGLDLKRRLLRLEQGEK
jgi:O-6-methylguanine DNA methyltransferase